MISSAQVKKTCPPYQERLTSESEEEDLRDNEAVVNPQKYAQQRKAAWQRRREKKHRKKT